MSKTDSKPAPSRKYVVTDTRTGERRITVAKTAQQASAFATKGLYTVEPLSVEVALEIGNKVEVEDATKADDAE